MSHLHLESCLQLLLLTARVVFKGPTMYGWDLQGSRRMFCGKRFFFRETCLLVSEEFMFFQPKTRIPRRDVYKLLCGLESWRTPLKWCGRSAPRSKKRNPQAELCVRIPPTKVSLARFVLCLLSCLSRVRRFSSPEFIFPCTQVSFSQVRNKNRSEELVCLIGNPA